MKTRNLLTVFMITMIIGAYAQQSNLTLTYTADNNGQHLPLNSILIKNLTQGGDTTLYAPDTVLVLDYFTGMEVVLGFSGNGFSLYQNYPNPMQGKTTIGLRLPESENILVTVSDIMGRVVVNQEFKLEQGNHSFTFYPGREILYVLTVHTDRQSRNIKMFNSPSNVFGSWYCNLEYNGQQSDAEDYKLGNNLNNFVFTLGDQLQFTSTSALGNRTIIDTPYDNQTYTFQYGSDGAPCPSTPTVTDTDGNVYNTVLIGDQCWMKENLRTTKYRNGTTIENPTGNSDWQNNTTGAYAWYENDISWKDSYGALYNWHAVNNTSGLCPTGWHVPSDAEWTQLVNYMVAQGFPNINVTNGAGNALKSCQQVNSPLGGDCNTTEHPRWKEDDWSGYNHHGFDEFGFSALPGGYRSTYGSFNVIGHNGGWWSSTEYPSTNAWGRGMGYSHGGVSRYGSNKTGGFSVRCLRD